LAIQSDDFTAKLMDDMDARLLDFIKTKVNSFIKWDLVRFFYENPNTTDSVENIAKYAGRNAAAVESELEELVESGVMERELVEGIPVYSLASDKEMRQLVNEFILACEDRHFRVKAVYHIIRGMR
jgi:predicted transcriptional regulator